MSAEESFLTNPIMGSVMDVAVDEADAQIIWFTIVDAFGPAFSAVTRADARRLAEWLLAATKEQNDAD